MLAFSVAMGAAMTPVTLLLRPILSGNKSEFFIALFGFCTAPLLLTLHFVQGQVWAEYGIYLAFVGIAWLQLAAGLVKIASYLSSEGYVVLYGAMTLLVSLTKIMFYQPESIARSVLRSLARF